MRKRHAVLPVIVAAAVGASVLPAGAASSSIALKDNFFAPKAKTVKKGKTVTFKWAGKAPHNVTVVKGPAKFRSRTQTSGSFRHKFSKAGTYSIVCTIHPGMALKLKVK